jgi:hypothetical protein
MNARSIVPLLAVAIVAGGCVKPQEEVAAVIRPVSGSAASCDLLGSWEMVSMKMVTSDSTVEYDESERPTLKVLNGTHWMFIRQSGDRFIFAQGGRYTLEGDTYTETVEYSADPANIGQSYTFTCSVEGENWHHRGGLGNVQYDELWRRVR